MEKTLILIKPDAIERNLVGEVIERFEKKGMKIVGLKMLQMTKEMAAQHYHEHVGKGFYKSLEQFMTSQPIIAIAVEAPGAVGICRNMTGATFGAKATSGTIRGDYGISTSFNLLHSSADRDAAKRELEIFFDAKELFTYGRSVDKWIATEEDITKLS